MTMLTVRPKQTVSMYTRDGVRLDADVYRPNAPGQLFPVLLMRQPYGREIASTVVYAHPAWYASQGYIVAIQDVRGRGSSEGDFQLFAREIEDGEDAVNWAAQLPGSNGKVGMYGFSYQGMTQLYAAVNQPPALKAIAPAMIGYDLYHDWAYEGDAFCLQTNLAWALQLASETARRQGDTQVYKQLIDAVQNLPLRDTTPNYPGVIRNQTHNSQPSYSHYHDWLTKARDDEYWRKLSPANLLDRVDLPMFHVGGWFDTYLRGTLKLYHAMSKRSQHRQQLLVGAWGHIPWSRKVGSVDLGENALSPVDRMQVAWFDQYLKDIDMGLLTQPPVWLFEIGSNIWHSFQEFPAAEPSTFYLTTTGLAAIREDEGELNHEPAPNQAIDTFVHDPWRPVPSLGGHAGFPAGMFERSHLDGRSDVVTYTSPPLTDDLRIVGEVVAEIYATADKPSFDLSVILSLVNHNGTVYNITQGYQRCQSTQEGQVYKITLQPTCVKIPQGSIIRLSISAACFPAYSLNPGVKVALDTQTLLDAEIITVSIKCGGDGTELSRVCLPVLESGPQVRGKSK